MHSARCVLPMLATVLMHAAEPRLPIPPGQVPPGTVCAPAMSWRRVAHIAASSRCFIGSPSLAVLPDGTLVASNDIFGPGCSNDVTWIHTSHDRGETWERIAEIHGQWWSTLFLHQGALHLMGTNRGYGEVAIRRSIDGGRTWTTPRDQDSGLLLGDGRFHCSPQPVLVHDGRIWRAMEDVTSDTWGRNFRAFMMSAPLDADLLRAAAWTSSNRLASDPAWLGGRQNGWLEGNAVADADGTLLNILRLDVDGAEQVARLTISRDGATARFDPATGSSAFPGGAKKFTIRRDPAAPRWWTLASAADPQVRVRAAGQRNALVLASSTDLRRWTVHGTLIGNPDTDRHGYQYVDWQFDGEDIVAVCRTADDDGLGGAANYHDANLLTFHRLSGFRGLAR